jgi:hypothetical protein
MHIVIYTCILCTSRIGPIGTHRHIPPIQNVYDPGRDLIFSWTSLRYFAGDSRSQCSNVDERYQRCQLWYLGGTWNKLWCNGSWSSYSIIYIYIIIYILYTDILIYTCGMMRWLNIKKWWALYIDILPWLIVGEKRDLAGFNHQTLGVCQFWMNSWFSISLLAIWGYGIDSMLQ